MTNNGSAVPAPVARTEPSGHPLSATLREAMGQFPTGITVLTAAGDDWHGMTANAFTSVSLDPPLVLCCVSRTARMHAAIASAGSFAVSMLGADQEGLARYFADKRRPGGAEQFDAVPWVPGPHTGAPLLSGSLAWLECKLTEAHDGGDHSIFLGQVLSASRIPDRGALVFYRGAFRQVI